MGLYSCLEPAGFVWSLMLCSRGPPAESVELILQGIDSRHNSDSQDNDQPDYDSVASDEEPVQEATCGDGCNDGRTKVKDCWNLLLYWDIRQNVLLYVSHWTNAFLCHMFCHRARSHLTSLMDQSQCRNSWRWRVPWLHQKPKYNNFLKSTVTSVKSCVACRARLVNAHVINTPFFAGLFPNSGCPHRLISISDSSPSCWRHLVIWFHHRHQ